MLHCGEFGRFSPKEHFFLRLNIGKKGTYTLAYVPVPKLPECLTRPADEAKPEGTRFAFAAKLAPSWHPANRVLSEVCKRVPWKWNPRLLPDQPRIAAAQRLGPDVILPHPGQSRVGQRWNLIEGTAASGCNGR